MDKKAKNKKANSKAVRPRGAPRKQPKDKIDLNGLRPDQNEWLRGEGDIRGLPAAVILREAVDWYITAKETKRGDVTASQQFDNVFIGVDQGRKGGDETVKTKLE